MPKRKEPTKLHQHQLQMRPNSRKYHQQRRRNLGQHLGITQPVSLPQLADSIHVRKRFNYLLFLLFERILMWYIESIKGCFGFEG
jgi:hypothetical protein